MSVLRLLGTVTVAGMVAACGQPEPDAPVVRGQPVFDKFGGIAGCESGEYIPGAAQEFQCLPPTDDCIEGYNAAGQPIPCPPRRDDDDDDDDDNGRNID